MIAKTVSFWTYKILKEKNSHVHQARINGYVNDTSKWVDYSFKFLAHQGNPERTLFFKGDTGISA